MLLLLPLTAHPQADQQYWTPNDQEWVVRSVGGVLGLGVDDHGAMDLNDFAEFSEDPLPRPPGNLGDYYFGINSISVGLMFGPRVAIARLRNGLLEEKGWNVHLGINPRFFYQYYYLDSAAADTLYTTEYLYLMGQVELAIGGGPYWRTKPVRSFYLAGSINGEVGLAPPGLIAVSGTRTASLGIGNRARPCWTTLRHQEAAPISAASSVARPVFVSDIGWTWVCACNLAPV